MIPYWTITFPKIFGLQIHMFGILVAIGIIVGARLTHRRGRELGLEDDKVASMITTVLICGFILAHLFAVFAYQTFEELTLWRILNPFGGLSSYGGFMGAVGGLFYWCRKHKQDVMPYADSLAYGLATGWMFGRLGCFSAHDHPGHRTDFFLAVQYPGGARHDLGLYEAIWSFGVTLVFQILSRVGKQPRPLGLYVSLLVTFYAPVRFFFDSLRQMDMQGADPRYFGMTPAQHLSIVTFFAGLYTIRWTIEHQKKKDAALPTSRS